MISWATVANRRIRVAEWRACRCQFRDQLRGRGRVFRAGRRSRFRGRAYGRRDRRGCRPRPGRRKHVHVREPGRILAPASDVHQAKRSLHRVWRRPCSERNPEAAAAIREAGWDVACHGLRWEMLQISPRKRNASTFALRQRSSPNVWGAARKGRYTRYAPSLFTRACLLDAGYSYDSDAYDDELPYWVKVGRATSW